MFVPKIISSLSIFFTLKVFIALFFILLATQAAFFYGEWEKPRFLSRHVEPPFRVHGKGECLPSSLPSVAESRSARASCPPTTVFSHSKARMATVTAHFGDPQEHYQRALGTHLLHSIVHNTEIHIMCAPIVDSLWNKPAFILSLLLDEMIKPPEERLEWLFWADRDTLILDQCRPTSSFLPPSTERDETNPGNEPHLLVTNDWNGLNNGVFLLRVNLWAVELFTAILAFRYYEPDVNLPFTEQSAMEIVMKEDKFKNNVRLVPQKWFNTYPDGNATEFEVREVETGLQEYHARRGDFLVHFAGMVHKDEAIYDWLGMLGSLENVWTSGRVLRDVTSDIASFWA